MKEVTCRKIGSSVGIIIPKEYLFAIGAELGTKLKLSLVNKKLVLNNPNKRTEEIKWKTY